MYIDFFLRYDVTTLIFSILPKIVIEISEYLTIGKIVRSWAKILEKIFFSGHFFSLFVERGPVLRAKRKKISINF